ncbi:hypothetical protein OJ253_3297 [Cryptosporidium canis]|uniref:SAP domain-containing protein n=1 Tax=Cryptosporidium canis TaxID=195482 RepID=A0A9D5DJY9_9CRYT|nr:hypothetical protein OJ253_3297 [Cryptosporidium canis]
MTRSKRLSYIPGFDRSGDPGLEAGDQAMEIDAYCDGLVGRGCGENGRDVREAGMADEMDMEGQEDIYHDIEDDPEEDDEGSDTVFPLISEPLKTFVTVNPATLEDEELWPLSSLKRLCQYVGLSVKGNRRCILNRLQAWNGAPLSGAGHPDSYDTRSARFHTVPMAFLEKSRVESGSKVGDSGERSCVSAGAEMSLDESIGVHKGSEFEESEPINLDLKSFHSPCIVKKIGSLTSTPIASSRRGGIRSCLNTTSTPRKSSTQASKSAGRICFSPYNHVRVFLSNPGERELNMDPDSIFRWGDDYDYDYELEGDVQGSRARTERGSPPKEACLLVERDYVNEENSNHSNFWNSSGSIFTSKD